jgi:hypothetical protein
VAHLVSQEISNGRGHQASKRQPEYGFGDGEIAYSLEKNCQKWKHPNNISACSISSLCDLLDVDLRNLEFAFSANQIRVNVFSQLKKLPAATCMTLSP